MKTLKYNPSELELNFADALRKSREELEKFLPENKISGVNVMNGDNPRIVLTLTDEDGDVHELVITVIQRIDKQ